MIFIEDNLTNNSSADTEESSSIETESITESSTATENSTEESSSIETEAGTESSVETKDSVETSIRQESINNAESATFTTTPLDTTMYATQQCNIRKGPSTANDIIGTLSQAEGIHITGKVDNINWYEVSLTDGSTGYISSKLLTETKPTVQIETPSPTTQQEAASQADRPLHENEVINKLTGGPLKPGDVLSDGSVYLGEIITDENGNQIAPNGAVFHRGGK